MRLIYFSPVHAASYAQRPHFMVRAALEAGVEAVAWVNPYPCRLPGWQDLRRGRGFHDQGTPTDGRVQVIDVPALPIEPLPLGSRLNRRLLWPSVGRQLEEFAAAGPLLIGVGRPCALALAALRELRPANSFFDAMDNFPEFHRGLSRRSMRWHEDAVAGEVDWVIASSTYLADKFARRKLRVEKVLNAFESFAGAGVRDQGAGIRGQGPEVLGYLGCLGRWFDWPLVLRLAAAMPQARIELVGPCAVAPPRNLPANVHLLPACRQSEAARRLARFSVGLIPFHKSPLTAGVDPIKYYEYRAAGLPILSSRFGEMTLRGRENGVYCVDEARDVAAVVSAALAHRYEPAAAAEFCRENNWTSRFLQAAAFQSLLPARPVKRAA